MVKSVPLYRILLNNSVPPLLYLVSGPTNDEAHWRAALGATDVFFASCVPMARSEVPPARRDVSFIERIDGAPRHLAAK